MPTESWVGSETSIGTEQIGSSWDICQLGEIYLPGVITIEDFSIGQDVDVQKRRRKEKPRLRDNGMKHCSFTIKVELRASQWAEWQQKLPHIQPQRPGAVRRPLAIVHPLPNANNVSAVYVSEIKYEPPSARKGMVVLVRVAEWFEEERETKATPSRNSGPPPEALRVKYSKPDYFGDPNKLAQAEAANRGFLVGPEGFTERDIEANMFDDFHARQQR
jgi:hypothetical protein